MASRYEKKIPLLDCGHEYIGLVLYGRWKIVLIWYISQGINRPGELQRKIPQASRRVLDAQLKQLLDHQIVSKTSYNEKIPRAIYQLTELGQSLIPVIKTMTDWGNSHKLLLKSIISETDHMAEHHKAIAV